MGTTLRKAVRVELDDIAAQLVRFDEEETQLKKQKEELKGRFLKLALKYLDETGRSRVWDVPQFERRVRATWTEPTIPVDWDVFMREIGPELFAEVCTVKSAELSPERWNTMVSEERARDSQLQKCIGDPRPRSPGVYIEKLPKNGG